MLLGAIGLLLGLLLGILGGGGSILTVPALVYGAGIAPKPAIAMSLAVVGVTSAVGSVWQWRRGKLQSRVALLFGLSAMAGALVGARLAVLLRGDVQLLLLAMVMVAAAVGMLRGSGAPAGAEQRLAAPPRTMLLGTTGVVVGIMTGIVGIGGGFLIVPALTLLAGLPMADAVGTSLVIIAMNSAAGFVGTAGHVAVPWQATAVVIVGAIVGIAAGTRIGGRLSATQLQRGFAVFLLGVAAFVVYANRALLTGGPPDGSRATARVAVSATITA